MAGRRPEPARTRTAIGLGGALGLTLAALVLPGAAHLWSGRRRAGAVLAGCAITLYALAGWMFATHRGVLIQLAVRPQAMLIVGLAVVPLAVGWALVVSRSYFIVRPVELAWDDRVLGGCALLMVCVLLCACGVVAARYAFVERGMVTAMFPADQHGYRADAQLPGQVPPAGATRRGSTAKGPAPRSLPGRVNILLLGGDAGPDRIETRTDSIELISVDTRTGRSVALGLPRNLEHAPMPAGAMQHRFPGGFDDLLNAVYRYGTDHPSAAPGATNPGAAVLMGTVRRILGMPVDYYALIDLNGFRDVVDAIGGLRLCVHKPIEYDLRGRYLAAGCRRLDGQDTLRFARSRIDGSDYTRMARQRCVLAALAGQADPWTALRSFGRLAKAARDNISTDIPRGLLPALVSIAPKVRATGTIGVQFVPPMIDSATPDWAKIRRVARDAVAASERGKAAGPTVSLNAGCRN